MLYRKIFFFLTSLTLIGQSLAQNLQCPDISRTLATYNIDNSSSEFLTTVYSKYCYEDGSVKSSGGGLGIDVIVKAIPVKFTGNYSNSQEAHSNFCKTYSSLLQSNTATASYTKTISDSAIQTIDHCLSLQAAGVQISHDVTNYEALSFYMRSSVTSSFELQGVQTTGAVKCTGIVKGALTKFDEKLNLSIKNTQGFSCKRSGTAKSNGSRNFDEATITVLTNQGNYPVLWPKNQREPEDMAAEIQKRLGQITADNSMMATMLRTIMNPKPIPIYQCPTGWIRTGSPDLAWASYGCLGQISTESVCSDIGWKGGNVTNQLSCSPLGSIRPY